MQAGNGIRVKSACHRCGFEYAGYMNSIFHPSKHSTVMHKPVGLIERVRGVIHYKLCSLRIEQAYVQWVRRFVAFHGKRHPYPDKRGEGRLMQQTRHVRNSPLQFQAVSAVRCEWLTILPVAGKTPDPQCRRNDFWRVGRRIAASRILQDR